MIILNKENFITITTTSYDEFKLMSTDIKENISNSIIRENKIIIFPKKDNFNKRINFIKNIDSKIKVIDIFRKNIMIYLESKYTLEKNYIFDILIDKNYKNIEIKYEFKMNKKMKIFFELIFKKCELIFNYTNLIIKIDEKNNDNIKDIIEKLENKKSIFGMPCIFNISIKNETKILAISSLLENEFKALNLNSSDNYESFKKKYKILSRKYHPDLNIFNNELLDRIYQKRFQKIQKAYSELKYFYKQNLVA